MKWRVSWYDGGVNKNYFDTLLEANRFRDKLSTLDCIYGVAKLVKYGHR